MTRCPKCNSPVEGKVKFCPSCGEKIQRQTTNEKRARLTDQKKNNKAPLLAVAALVIAGVVVFAVIHFMTSGSTFRTTSTSVSGSGGDLSFKLSTFDDGKPKYFTYKASGGKEIRFFILKSSDGVIRAAFDACDVCYASRKGYRQEGNVMVCNNCGQKFISTRINEIRGGCNPAPLERRIEGDQLVIAASDILSGARYF